jgi:nucleoside-diphosphate-sugar epimerase
MQRISLAISCAAHRKDMDFYQSCESTIISKHDLILVTGAAGFIGSKVVERLVDLGFCNLRCFVRTSRSSARLQPFCNRSHGSPIVQLVEGNLLSAEDCFRATQDVALILHLAAGRGEKSYPDAFLNSVVTTRNLIEASISHGTLRRFVTISSFAVYSNYNKAARRILDESCPLEAHPELRGDAYTFAKVKQDEIVVEYCNKLSIPYVIVRPGHVYGPGNEAISARVGIGTFGTFLHLGGPNRIPLTYVDNCAEAIVLAGLKPGVDGEVFNVVDDDLPTSRQFLGLYKKNVARFKSLYLPHFFSYMLCWLWERFSGWSAGQLPPVFNRRRWHAFWKKTHYSNKKLKQRLGWTPGVPMAEGLRRYCEACQGRGPHA